MGSIIVGSVHKVISENKERKLMKKFGVIERFEYIRGNKCNRTPMTYKRHLIKNGFEVRFGKDNNGSDVVKLASSDIILINSEGKINKMFTKIEVKKGKFYGNCKSKKLHRYNCEWLIKSNKIGFKEFETIQDAIREGYELCKVCLRQ
ncbi:hypothetical protein [Vallitalea guaymasensis]|uniref:Uncharacterized protein n=1 Tax=Vallitalea guaymasensis TaxID=1185412 RepID=A0A8J8M8B8_9FIRM|nr:hypothetical protein [Vallitalea guaymasensis]QUH28212.1 hypothetical protein HYG85_04495 [Vallitalea guaymasensis]